MEASSQPSINQRFDTLAASDLSEFRQFFKRLHKLFPVQAAEACLLYIASHGLDPAARSMAYWLVGDPTYIAVLLDAKCLPPETAAKAITVVRDVDPQFLFKFAKAIAALKGSSEIMHALALLPALSDHSIVIPWLRSLGQNADVRVRSKAAKLLSELRPNKGLIEKQMQSPDARIRAGAVEALWHMKDPDACTQLRSALNDVHHRVAANALVGMHRHGMPDVLDRMVEMSSHKHHLFRAAVAWAMGFVKDPGCIPTLQELSRDGSLVVRKRALSSLLALESLKAPDVSSDVAAEGDAPPQSAKPEPDLPTPEPVSPPVPRAPEPSLKFTLFQ